MVKGREIAIVSSSGKADTVCTVSLDKKLTAMSLSRPTGKSGKMSTKEIPMEDITQISTGADDDEEDAANTDELCARFFLKDAGSVAFRFNDMEERDTFVLCMSMFVDGRRAANEKEKNRKRSSSGGPRGSE